MQELGFEFSGREVAVGLWAGVLGALVLIRKDLRASARSVLRTAANPQVLSILELYVTIVALEVWLGHKLGVWHQAFTKDTLVWLIVGGFPVLLTFTESERVPNFWRRQVLSALSVAVVVEYVVALHTWAWYVEFVAQPLLLALVYLSVSGGERREPHVRKRAENLLAAYALIVLVWGVYRTVQDWSLLDTKTVIWQILLPVWLALLLLPFVWLVALYSAYEGTWRMMRLNDPPPGGRRRAILALASVVGPRLSHANRMRAGVGYIAKARRFRDARALAKEWLDDRQERIRAHKREARALKENVGKIGVDNDGRRLDRREFRETSKALATLHLQMMGWYRQGSAYPRDLVDRFRESYEEALPSGVDINVRVSQDGQRWYAWRRTPSGWFFATGASAPPPSEWRYDGPQPPTGFPGMSPEWGKDWVKGHESPNWS